MLTDRKQIYRHMAIVQLRGKEDSKLLNNFISRQIERYPNHDVLAIGKLVKVGRMISTDQTIETCKNLMTEFGCNEESLDRFQAHYDSASKFLEIKSEYSSAILHILFDGLNSVVNPFVFREMSIGFNINKSPSKKVVMSMIDDAIWIEPYIRSIDEIGMTSMAFSLSAIASRFEKSEHASNFKGMLEEINSKIDLDPAISFLIMIHKPNADSYELAAKRFIAGYPHLGWYSQETIVRHGIRNCYSYIYKGVPDTYVRPLLEIGYKDKEVFKMFKRGVDYETAKSTPRSWVMGWIGNSSRS